MKKSLAVGGKFLESSCKIHYNRPALPSDVPRLGPSMPGRFATTSGNITDVNYVRTNLAIKGEQKPEIDIVVGYKVKEGITLPSLQGPQIDLPLDIYLPGGAEQINIILDRSANAMDYLILLLFQG